MYAARSITLALATCVSMVAAQNSTLAYNNTQISVRSSTQYSGNVLVGYHVGAGLSYMVAGASASGDSFTYNTSATSDQLLDNTIVPGYQMPCYIVNTPEISNVSGPLECGVGDQSGYYDVARVTASNGASLGAVTFEEINQWFICAVQSFTYGWIQGTVVGLFGSGVPLGPGVTNCTAIDALVLAATSNSSTSSTATTTMTATHSSAIVTTSSTFSNSLNRSTVYPLSTPQSTTSASASASSSSKLASNTTVSPTLPSQTTSSSVVTPVPEVSSSSSDSSRVSATNTAVTAPPAVPVTPPYSATSYGTATVTVTAPSSATTSTTNTGSLASSSVSPVVSSTSATSPSTISSSTSGKTTTTVQPLSTSNTSSMTTVTILSSSIFTTASTTFSTGSNFTNPIASYSGTYAPIATYAGAANVISVSGLLGLTLALAALLS